MPEEKALREALLEQGQWKPKVMTLLSAPLVSELLMERTTKTKLNHFPLVLMHAFSEQRVSKIFLFLFWSHFFLPNHVCDGVDRDVEMCFLCKRKDVR